MLAEVDEPGWLPIITVSERLSPSSVATIMLVSPVVLLIFTFSPKS